MDKFVYHREGEDKCRQNIGWKKSCASCLFETLCLFEKNQERMAKDYKKSDKISEEK